MPVNGFYFNQLERLQGSLVRMGELAGGLVADSVASLVARDPVLAREVIERDNELDRLEDENEEHTIQIIALNQPVAKDLRLVVALLRVNTTIERVGDLAVNIANAAIRISDKPEMKPYVDIPRCYDLVRNMWDDSIQCFSTLDEGMARALREKDDLIDRANQETIAQLLQISTSNPTCIYTATNLLGVSKALERIGDLAVDIADEVVYVCRGEFRHARTQRRTA
jgi:phosphate transport system protein